MKPSWIVIAAWLAATEARAGDDEPDVRGAAAARLLDTNVGDAPYTWSAMVEACGMDCEYAAWGGCWLDAGAIDCEVRVQDTSRKKPVVITVRDATRDAAALAAARDKLIDALGQVGYSPIWLDEHRFETPPVDVATWNLTFRWNWKKRTVTVLNGKKRFKALTAPKLRKGLGVTSAAIWYRIADEGSAGWALLRVHGEGDEGEQGDATALVPLPAIFRP